MVMVYLLEIVRYEHRPTAEYRPPLLGERASAWPPPASRPATALSPKRS
jgi:hypothetical protein